MSNNYDDYGYEDKEYDDGSAVKKRILIGFLIVAAIIIVVLLILKGCAKNDKPTNPTEPTFDYEKTLLDLVCPMDDEPEKIKIQKMDSINENEVLLYVYATSSDISRLIGRGGNMASSIRHMMSVCSAVDNKKVSIKFESY